jgi:hypothetical protein
MFRLQLKGRGILLLHDIHPATALALPHLFAALKAGGYKIVHVIPSSVGVPATATEPQDWRMVAGPHTPAPWPHGVRALRSMSFAETWQAIAAFGPQSELPFKLVTPPEWAPRGVDPKAKLDAQAIPAWPAAESVRLTLTPGLPRPDPRNFGVDAKFESLTGMPARPEPQSRPENTRKGAAIRAHRARARRNHTAMAH